MPLILDGTNGISGVDGSAGTPSLQGTDSNTGVFYATDIVGISTGGTERMRINSSGNVGVGTSTINERFRIKGTSTTGSTLEPYFNCTNEIDSDFYIYVTGSAATDKRCTIGPSTNTALAFLTNGTERMRITSGGDVCVGTTTASYTAAGRGNITIGGSTGSILTFQRSGSPVGYVYHTSNGMYISQDEANPLIFQTNGTERMRIDSSGRALFGATTPGNNSYRMTVSNTNGAIVANASGSGDANFYSTSSTIGYHFYGDSGGGTGKFYVINNGTIYSTNTAVQSISDVRHKENIKDLETGLAEVLALKPRRFDWKEGCGTGEKNVAGFIAQEVEPILPDLIGDWQNQMGSDEKFKSLAMGNMLPTLVKAIQEQQAMIEELKQEVAALKAK